MAQSFVQYTGDGETRVYSVPFKYLDRSHVRVTVNDETRDFDWLSSNTIQFVGTPLAGRTIDIRRHTPNSRPLVDFSDGSTITEEDLDKLAYQNVYLNQEAIDLYKDVSGTADGLVNKVQQALASAATSEADSAEALSRAANAENTVIAVGSAISTNAATASSAASTASTAATTASAAAGTAVSNSALAVTKAAEALASANSAAASAAVASAAANFNPADFYTKVQINGLLTTTTFELPQINGLSAAIAGKADATHSHTVAQISGLQTLLDAKMSVTGTANASQKWSTPRTITLTGGVTGIVSIDGSANVSMTATVTNNSHSHTVANVTGLQAALDGKATTSHTHTVSEVTNLQSLLDAKAPLASPALTGTPTAPTAASGSNSTQVATTAFVNSALQTNNGAFQPLDSTLTKIAALQGSASFGSMIYWTQTFQPAFFTTSVLGRALMSSVSAAEARGYLALGAMSTKDQVAISDLAAPVTISKGGTGQTNPADSATALGVGTGDAVAHMRVHAGGNTTLYNPATDTAEHAYLGTALIRASRTNAVVMQLQRTAGDGDVIQFYRGTVNVGSIATSPGAISVNGTSDQNLKEDFQPIDTAIFDAIKVYDFKWKGMEDRGQGVKAQELHEVLPVAVRPGYQTEDGNTVPWAVDYTKLIPHLIAKIQELSAKVATLEASA
jgi:hypothetical protein